LPVSSVYAGVNMDWKPILPFLILAVGLSAGLTIRAHYLHPPRPVQLYVFKPLTIILILAAALLPGSFRTDFYAGAISLGLLFSLAGDIGLMLPGNRVLLSLVCFLFAHTSYIFAFLSDSRVSGFPWAAIPLGGIGVLLFGYLWPGLAARLKPAVGVYVVVIVTMATMAVQRAAAHLAVDTLSAAIGALLFMASDALLAVHRFRRPFRRAHVFILVSYYLGQLLIALSVGLRAVQ
jgi:uncharacterized membrane protein YhhN